MSTSDKDSNGDHDMKRRKSGACEEEKVIALQKIHNVMIMMIDNDEEGHRSSANLGR